METMTIRSIHTGKLSFFLAALIVLAGFLPGFAEDQDLEQCLEQVGKAAMQGDADAQFAIGFAYEYGGIGQVVNWRNTSQRSQHYLGRIFYENCRDVPENRLKAIRWYLKAAKQGHVTAQVALATLYRWSRASNGGKEAAKWYRKAAEQGDASAQYHLGRMYAKGEGVTENYKKSVVWLSRAANQGNAEAQFGLGYMYETGWGVPEDNVRAYAWMVLAAAQGNKEAATGKDSLRPRMSPEQVTAAQGLAAELYKRIEASKSK